MQDAGLLAAIGAAALMGAMAFRQLTATLIKLNDQLQETIDDRHETATERDSLQGRVTELESRLAAMQARIDAQSAEIERLRTHLAECDKLVALLRDGTSIDQLKAVPLT